MIGNSVDSAIGLHNNYRSSSRATRRLVMIPMHDQSQMTIQRVRRTCIVRSHNSAAYRRHPAL